MRRVEGFSLLELVMVIVILGILAAFVGPVLYNAIRAYDQLQTGGQTQAKMRYALERLSREIREIRRQTTDAAMLDIAQMTANTLQFVNTQGHTIVIGRNGAALNLTDTTLSGMLTDQVGGFSLAYFQPDAVSAAASASSLGFVQVSLVLTEGANQFSARVRVDVRNVQ